MQTTDSEFNAEARKEIGTQGTATCNCSIYIEQQLLRSIITSDKIVEVGVHFLDGNTLRNLTKAMAASALEGCHSGWMKSCTLLPRDIIICVPTDNTY